MIQRTALWSVTAENDAGVTFAVERWWMPTGGAEEALTRIALVWTQLDDGEPEERLVLLSDDIALDIATTLLGEIQRSLANDAPPAWDGTAADDDA